MTSNEIQQQQTATDELSLLPPHQPIRAQAFDQLAQTVEAMKLAGQFAASMCKTTAVPDVYRIGSKANSDRKPEDVIANAAAAVIYGLELELTPSQALQNVFSVGGKPAIYARTAAALLQRRGYRFSTVESTDKSVTVRGWSRDGELVEESTWTIERAEQAGYAPTIDPKTGDLRKNKWNKPIGNEKYLTDPQAMLYSKALMEVCRKLAPDVLLGIADRDDAHLFEAEAPRRVQNTAPAQNNDLRARLAGKPSADEPQAEDAPTPTDEPTSPAEEAVPTDTADEAQPEPEPEPSNATDEPSSDQPEPKAAADQGADTEDSKSDAAQTSEDNTEPPHPADAPPEAATKRAVPPITKLQLSKLWTVLGKEGLTDRDQALEWIGSQLQREVTSTKELTKTEAAQLIDFLEKAQAADAAKGTQ
ncbi:hypothetical protein [Gordonia terrae]|uniref:hypothetical protein n=1 Tax=Gordonia terrae TaxID=2055 RepID=UPI003F6A6B2B